MPTHHFDGQVRWSKGAEGVEAGNHEVRFEGRPSLVVSAAPAYRGDPTCLNPEELFLASLASCHLLTYLALARRAGVDVVVYEDRPRATLSIAERKMRVTGVELRPRITLAPGSDVERARGLVAAAHDGCFIASSVSCPVHAEAEIVVADE